MSLGTAVNTRWNWRWTYLSTLVLNALSSFGMSWDIVTCSWWLWCWWFWSMTGWLEARLWFILLLDLVMSSVNLTRWCFELVDPVGVTADPTPCWHWCPLALWLPMTLSLKDTPTPFPLLLTLLLELLELLLDLMDLDLFMTLLLTLSTGLLQKLLFPLMLLMLLWLELELAKLEQQD